MIEKPILGRAVDQRADKTQLPDRATQLVRRSLGALQRQRCESGETIRTGFDD